MSVSAKKVAAITSAIYTCLGAEGEVVHTGQQPQETRPRFAVNSPWALSGRQAMMDRQYHVQFRLNR